MYKPKGSEPFKLSRSKIDLFMECPRCFYMDRRLGVARPPGFPFTLNTAVDALLKKEFDLHRKEGTKHPLLEKYGVDAIPAMHKDLPIWRNNFKGITFLHEATRLQVSGAIDDLWKNPKGEFILVDYKATAKEEDIKELDKPWYEGYKRQLEIYQWLFQKNGFAVSPTAYILYCNGKADRPSFNATLNFDLTLIPYVGKTDWIDETLTNIYSCLEGNAPPEPAASCDYCSYTTALNQAIANRG
jgi:CRISPR/Cas system-associated exonuclease Cas4 (RecB family)